MDAAAATVTFKSTDTGAGVQLPHHRISDGTNFMPTMDAVGRAGIVKITDGTNTLPTMDVVGRAGFIKLTDGTNTMPTMDAVARRGYVTITDGTNSFPTMDTVGRKGFVAITDGTNTAGVSATNAALSETAVTSQRAAAHLFALDAAAGAGSQQVPLKVESTAQPNLRVAMWNAGNAMPSMDTVGRAGFVKVTDGTNTLPTMDVVGRKGFVSITDGTNTMPTLDAVGRRGYFQHTDGTNSTPAADVAARAIYAAPPGIINPSANFTRPADTTAYASGDLVANSVTAGSVVPLSFATATRVAAGNAVIKRVRLRTGTTNVTNAQFRVHFYTASPTVANGDNGVWSTDQTATYLGSVDVTKDKAFTDGSWGVGAPAANAEIAFALGSGTTIYALIEARAAYTPGSAEVFTVVPEIVYN